MSCSGCWRYGWDCRGKTFWKASGKNSQKKGKRYCRAMNGLLPPVRTMQNRIPLAGTWARAALFSGCKFFGGYPITPATEIMEYLQREIWTYGGSVLQAEDEIAGIAA